MESISQLKPLAVEINSQSNPTDIKESPEFTNNFGAVFKEEMIIHKSNHKISINLKQNTKISFLKRRKYHWNIICFSLSMILVYIIFLYENNYSINLVLGFSTFLLTIIGFTFSAFQYKFILVNKLNFIEIIVHKHMKTEAEEIVSHLNKRTRLYDMTF